MIWIKPSGEGRILYSIPVTPDDATPARLLQDLRNELTSILRCVDALALLGAPQGTEYLGEARVCAERAQEIADTLLVAARQWPPRREPTDLNVVVRTAAPALASIAGPHISIELRLSPEPVPVPAHGGELERILVNLVLNASHAVAGRGALAVETALVSHPSHGGTELPRGRYARLTVTVADTGPAAADHADEMGLAPSSLAYSVDHLQGTVTVANEAGRGVSLNVFLPLIAAL